MSTRRPAVLVVEDDAAFAGQIRWALEKEYEVILAGCRNSALQALSRHRPDLVLLDLCLPPENNPEEGFRVLREARAQDFTTVVMSGVEEREPALLAVDQGAYDFFAKPIDFRILRIVIHRALERHALERENRGLRERLRCAAKPEQMIGNSPAMRELYEAIDQVADSPLTVAIRGESGTGKGLVARAIHDRSARRDRPFIAVHCASLPETLLEAELFGHEKGAFTGAAQTRIGRFEAASGGTLFLDEIGCLDHAIQIKLLRVLEERSVERLGANRSNPVDIRLIVATNEDLEEKVRRGELREDFYFRIMVFPIRVPPLSERVEDIPLLAEHFLEKLCEGQKIRRRRLSEEARLELVSSPWPGNVRQLRNVVEAAALVVDGQVIEADQLRRLPFRTGEGDVSPRTNGNGFKSAVEAFERRLLVEAIKAAHGVKAEAARSLKLDPGQMKYLVRKYDL